MAVAVVAAVVVAVVEVVVVVVATDPTTTLVDKISWWVDHQSPCCCFLYCIVTNRSRGGSGATRSHKAAAPASVEQTECGSKISRGWCHRFQRFPKDDVTDFKDFNDVPWMTSQFSNMLQMRQERFHRFHRCQIDYVTNLKIQRCLKDDLKDVTLMMSQNSQRCHRWQKDDITKMSKFQDCISMQLCKSAWWKVGPPHSWVWKGVLNLLPYEWYSEIS